MRHAFIVRETPQTGKASSRFAVDRLCASTLQFRFSSKLNKRSLTFDVLDVYVGGNEKGVAPVNNERLQPGLVRDAIVHDLQNRVNRHRSPRSAPGGVDVESARAELS